MVVFRESLSGEFHWLILNQNMIRTFTLRLSVVSWSRDLNTIIYLKSLMIILSVTHTISWTAHIVIYTASGCERIDDKAAHALTYTVCLVFTSKCICSCGRFGHITECTYSYVVVFCSARERYIAFECRVPMCIYLYFSNTIFIGDSFIFQQKGNTLYDDLICLLVPVTRLSMWAI